jgi:O-antigen ligase
VRAVRVLRTGRHVWLLLLMILIMPFEMSPYLYISDSFIGLVPDFTVIKLLGLVGFAWAMVELASRRSRETVLGSTQARLFVALFAGIVISAALNGSAMAAVTKYLVFVLFLPFVLIAVRTEGDVRRVVYTMVVALTIVFPYALRQSDRYGARLGVGLYEPNYLAANLLLVIPLAFAISSERPSATQRWLWRAAGMVLVIALVLTASRGGFCGLLVAGMLFAFRRFGAVGALGLLALLVVAVLPTDLGERALATIDRNAEEPAGLEASNEAHTALFWGGIRMMLDAPMFGVGPQRFSDYSREYSGLETAYIAHDTYLELGAEAGLPVLMVFAMLVAASVATLVRVAKAVPGRPLSAWAEGLATGLVGFAVAGAFISAQYEKFFWLSVFLSIVIARVADRRADDAAVTHRTAPPPSARA